MFSSANETTFFLTVEGLESAPLQVLAFDGIEGLNTEYVFEVTLVSKYLRFDITQLLSKPAYLSFTHDKLHGIHGVIHEVKRGNVGLHYAEYKIALVPKFTHLHKRRNHRAFIGKTVPEIIKTILEEHGILESSHFEFKFKDKGIYTTREFCCQYNESDAHYIYRLCEECGIGIHYVFTQTSHKMIFSDAQPFFKDLPTPLIYRSNSGFVADEPVLKRFDVGLVSNPLTSSERNYNFKNKKIPESVFEGTQSGKANQAVEPKLEHYHFPGRLVDEATAKQQAQLAIERLRTDQILAEAYGDIPTLHVGLCFTVTGFPVLNTMNADESWLVKQIKHQGRQPQVLEALGSSSSADSHFLPALLPKYFRQPISNELQFPSENLQQGYRNCLIATPKSIVYRPPRLHFKHKVIGSQTALVTGPAGEEIYCDEYGRVKLQFHWDRLGNYDEHSSHWVRVANIWAHNKYGGIEIPRIGMEVMVDFIEGDIDNPIIRGAVHNGINKVPYELPAIKTQSTLKTKEYKGSGYNEVLLDDTTGEVKTQIHSTPGTSQLNLGYLTHPRKSNGGGEHRGNGFELRTDDWGAIRSGKGMYISTYTRDVAQGQSLDAKEAVRLLEKSKDLNKELSSFATQHNAEALESVDKLNQFFNEHIKSLKEQIDSLKEQINSLTLEKTSKIAQMDDLRPSVQAEELSNTQQTEEFSKFDEPALVLASPKGIALTTPEDIHTYSDRDTILSTGQNINIASGKSFLASIAHHFSLFVQQRIKIIAAKGKIELQAQKSNIEATAQKTIKVTSVEDVVHITSPKEILLNAGGSYIKITASGIEQGTRGQWQVYSTQKEMIGPKTIPYILPTFNMADSWLQVSLDNEDTMQPMAGISYVITQNSGKQFTGKLDAKGIGVKHQTDEAGTAAVEYIFPDGKPELPRAPIDSLVNTYATIFKG